MKRLLFVAVVATLLAPAAGCNCMKWGRKSCAPPPVMQQECADGQYFGPMSGPPADIYGPAPQ